MAHARFDIQRINTLKNILQLLNDEESPESIRIEVEKYFKDANVVDVLLTEHEMIHKNYGITIADVIQLSNIHPHLYSNSLDSEIISRTNDPGHPIQILKEENKLFQSSLDNLNSLFKTIEEHTENTQEIENIDEIKHEVFGLGGFHNHFHRKEKLLFPLMEQYGYFDPPKLMWRGDDRIRSLYKALKGQMNLFPDIDFKHIRKTYDAFETEFRNMIFQEEALILPVLQSIFSENDWFRVAKESDAFGYALNDVEVGWLSNIENESTVQTQGKQHEQTEHIMPSNKNIPFGGGYLTTEEANLILNNLPLEITFVDKNSVFKYFNQITKSSDMMLVRTPISIGRNVANCHPPSSLSKVMTLVRDLKAKRRTSESMWFKMKGQYIHLTYKPLFNEQDEFLGILEYVQNIQPFFELPSEIKRGLSKIEE